MATKRFWIDEKVNTLKAEYEKGVQNIPNDYRKGDFKVFLYDLIILAGLFSVLLFGHSFQI